MARIARTRIPALLGALLVVVALAGCERAGELIPGDDDAEPEATATGVGGPILVSPPVRTDAGQGASPASVIADHELARMIVSVRAVDGAAEDGEVVRDGSGVVVNANSRLLLTSYHVVQPFGADGGRAYSTIAIATTSEPGAEPEVAFIAELAAADPVAGIAVLRVVGDASGEPLEEDAFDLPAATAAESTSLELGDSVRLFGHPGLLSNAPAQQVTVTNAVIERSRGDSVLPGRAWLGTDARLPYGDAGGPAFDQAGRLVGVMLQEAYSSQAPVGQARPIEFALPVIEAALAGEPYRAPLSAGMVGAGTAAADPSDGLFVSRPAFALNAVDEAGARELFDYTNSFPTDTSAIYYEYAAQGIEEGDIVEERWYLDGVQQDRLSSTYPWGGGRFGVVSDRIVAPSSAGLPDGRWRLEVWVDGSLRASAAALIGVSPRAPTLSAFDFGALATADRRRGSPPSGGASQLLFFFEYRNMEGAQAIHWLVFHDGQLVYESPDLPWAGGQAGRWWIGYPAVEDLEDGEWEFEVYVDGAIAAQETQTLP